jgi:hypothetical protein
VWLALGRLRFAALALAAIAMVVLIGSAMSARSR